MSDLNCSGPLDRKIRLKNLLDQGSVIGGNVEVGSTVDTISAIKHIIAASDEIIEEGNVGERAEHTAEVVMDAQILKMSHQNVAKILEASTDFNDGIYQNAIAGLVFKDDNDNWNALASLAIGICRASKFSPSMLGTFDIKTMPRPKPKKERQRKATKNVGEERQPEDVHQLEKQDKGAKKVKIIYKQIVQAFEANNRFPLPFYKLVIDPNSFMNTVENIFQVAFLARDGAVAFETGEDNMPHIRVTNPKEKDLVKHTNQSVSSVNLEVCNKMIEFYGIKDAMLHVDRTTH